MNLIARIKRGLRYLVTIRQLLSCENNGIYRSFFKELGSAALLIDPETSDILDANKAAILTLPASTKEEDLVLRLSRNSWRCTAAG